MIGDIRTPSGNEHDLVPILKLIDFGQAKENEHATRENLFKIFKVSLTPLSPAILFHINKRPADFADIAYQIMINLIARQVVQVEKTVSAYKGYRTHATEILPPQPENSGNDYKYATLDPQLRDLIAQCLAQDPGERPGLAEMLRVVQAAATGTVPETEMLAAAATSSPPPDESESVNETDEAVHAFLKKALYDAEHETMENKQTRDDPFGSTGDIGICAR